ncbi:iron-molybdenum cofactor biosynthesis protein [candidate division LCP-89 bacterium B3_LCP]|uniref:Iron-molybdenum cofactor biosynthesis protein n=1 Tax=candidate division LCP-89 bacterium B3_LCP TaxID=2012998 RepID=A0A532UNR5_UNCL8|nr:MAG: iron-molybdenum cofactor biosynthesis protein [candidate division LCP-89 bacterium B3_LCP]
MRIAIPSDEGTNIAAHTGRAGGFVIYDIDNNQAARVEYRSNTFTAHAKGECNGEENQKHHAHSDHGELLDALHDCQVMIARGMGPRLVMDLARRNIEVVFCESDVADTAAQQYAAGELMNTGKSSCDH